MALASCWGLRLLADAKVLGCSGPVVNLHIIYIYISSCRFKSLVYDMCCFIQYKFYVANDCLCIICIKIKQQKKKKSTST